MKRTLKRECKGLEIAGREAEAASRDPGAHAARARVSVSCVAGTWGAGRCRAPPLHRGGRRGFNRPPQPAGATEVKMAQATTLTK